jgi:hypothetical protein
MKKDGLDLKIIPVFALLAWVGLYFLSNLDNLSPDTYWWIAIFFGLLFFGEILPSLWKEDRYLFKIVVGLLLPISIETVCNICSAWHYYILWPVGQDILLSMSGFLQEWMLFSAAIILLHVIFPNSFRRRR